MTFKIFLMTLSLVLTSVASAMQKNSYPLDAVTLTYNQAEKKVFVTGNLISGQPCTNGLSSVTFHGSAKGTFEVDQDGWVRLVLPKSGAFLVGMINDKNEVILDVPFKAYQISERYDAIEQSFGQFDVDYITLDLKP